MSLSLLQGYSSAEEEEEDHQFHYQNSSEEDDEHAVPNTFPVAAKSLNPSAAGSLLPSALDAFTEISGPPGFLNNYVAENVSPSETGQRRGWHGARRNRKERKDLPAGAVMESKAQLVGIHERVRSDIKGNIPSSASSGQPPKDSLSKTEGEGKRVVTATNPNKEDAAELLRVCVECGIPKTYSSARGMVCPVCGDRPPADTNKQNEKKKGSTMKEKEKSKRMKGQSSHATWKSETEMQLRQQFD